MKIEQASASDVKTVALSMRDSDYAEFIALSFGQDKAELADILAANYGGRRDTICAWLDGKPVAVGGTLEVRPNVITLLFFATDEFERAALGLTRFITRQLFPRLREAGVHRIEAVSMEGHTTAHKWIEALGLKQETPFMQGYGKNGEAFAMFAWVK